MPAGLSRRNRNRGVLPERVVLSPDRARILHTCTWSVEHGQTEALKKRKKACHPGALRSLKIHFGDRLPN